MHVLIKPISDLWLFYAFIFSLLSISCNAPRSNPLDPKNPDNTYHVIRGVVKTVSIPNQPLPDVTVSFLNMSAQSKTDAVGNFNIEILSDQDGWLYFEKMGYINDSSYIDWQKANEIRIEKYLNAKPSLDSLQIYSVILNRYPDLQTEQLVVQAKVSDTDNDIDSVWVIIDPASLIGSLSYDFIEKWYKHIFSIYDLGIINIEELVGYNIYIKVKDIFANQFIIGQDILKRVIRQEVIFKSPSSNEITSPSPNLVWEIFNPGFEFNYLVQIYTAELTPQLVWQKSSLSSDLVNYSVDMALPPNEYFWVIWAIDTFGNRTRSKPASFKVE